ncbi:MAG: apolipoprotein N-acyltransferase [Fibrobacteraceae bacterium]|nr:apolipoprotein N-acyltransferase [Fibrobacteraceae bacterium]
MRITFAFLASQIALGLCIVALNPGDPGLYTFWPQAIPFILALPFLFFKQIRAKFSKAVLATTLISFACLAIDYTLRGHAGLVQLATTFIPLFLLGLVHFVIWNVRRLKEKESRTAFFISILAWGFYALAFPPLPLGPGAIVFLAPWFIILFKYKMQSALFGTFWSGIFYNAINYYWIYNVMKVGPAGFILFGLFLLIAYFSLYNTIAAAVFVKARDVKIKGFPVFLVLFPLFYAGLEMTRTYGDFSFPWSHLGYAFGNQLPLLQGLSLIGIFGYTALIIASNMIFALGFLKNKKVLWAVPILLFAVLWVYGASVLSKPEAQPFYLARNQKAPTIAVVQPSIHQTKKWSKDYYDSVITKTWKLIDDSTDVNKLDLIVLPETAIPDFIRMRSSEMQWIRQKIKGSQTSLFVGALDYDRNGKEPRPINFYNSGFLFHPGVYKPERYIKGHLVPFSERIPFDDVFPILNYVNFGEGDFVAGKEIPVFKPFDWTPFICYEAIYGDRIRQAIRNGSKLMVNITNDGWFGISTAPGQHLNLIRYRAIENGYPVVRTANSGISVFIDEYGHEDQLTGLFTERVIKRKMPLRTRDTLYVHIGDAVEHGLLLFFFAYLIALFAIRRIQKKSTD